MNDSEIPHKDTSTLHPSTKVIMGWKETVDLLDWGVRSLIAKADTGAGRSTIDATNIEMHDDGTLSFDIMLHRTKRDLRHRVRVKPVKRTSVKSSNGETEYRYVVRTSVGIGPAIRHTELTLSDRSGMTCRMLLGRRTLRGDFIVDSDRKYALRTRCKTTVEATDAA